MRLPRPALGEVVARVRDKQHPLNVVGMEEAPEAGTRATPPGTASPRATATRAATPRAVPAGAAAASPRAAAAGIATAVRAALPGRRRATHARRRGRARAEQIARRVGTGLREARLAQGRLQAEVAAEAGISQPFYSRIERGLELGAALETLASCAAALGVQLAGFVEAMPGASLPRDIQHLRRQALLVRIAETGGWHATPEAAVRSDGPRPRSIDLLLVRAAGREAAVVEVWDLLADGGEAMRGLEGKVAATRVHLGPGWRVEGLLLLRRTHRNRQLLRELGPLVRARYPASSAGWLAALRDGARPMPDAGGFAWTSVSGDRLFAARLG